MRLYGKLFIEADIFLKTGLTIGGDKASSEIGGIDNNVIKDANGVPYIPGSSIKGKIRSLLERSTGKFNLIIGEGDNKKSSSEYDYDVEKMITEENIDISDKSVQSGPCKCGKCDVCVIFGTGASDCSQPTRLYVRDALLDEKIKDDMFNKKGQFSSLELDYTESKWENIIDRLTSRATPRNIERVPAGAIFKMEMVYNVYEKEDIDKIKVLIQGLSLLEDDYLGANGSRGYGKIQFKNIEFKLKTIDDYKQNKDKSNIQKKEKISEIDIKSLIEELQKELKFN